MFGTKQQTSPATDEKPTLNTRGKVAGTTYDLCKRVKDADGKEKLKQIGTVFIRVTGNGGVAWVTDEDGTKHELPIFARKAKKEAKPEAAAAKPAA